ncbi:hypothetical protein [Brevundimonas bullata]|uniref:hypothetical protein n=1 Tax=Brevundimonas bullata TaxID=13160 RepID=UPI003D9A87F6
MNSIIEGDDRKSLIISDEQIPFDAYQAIYHKLTGRVEKLNRLYKDAYVITKDDIKQLHLRLHQLVRPWKPRGSRVQISHSLKEGHGAVYSSMDKFDICDVSNTACSQDLTYEFDFLLVVPNDVKEAQDIAQRYKVEVNIRQQFPDNDDVRLPYFIRQLGHIGSTSTKIEYADYAVAQSIDACISGWIDTLKSKRPPWVVRQLFNIEGIVDTFLDSAVRSISIAAGAAYIAVNLESISPTRAISLALFCIALGFFSFTIVSTLTELLYGLLRRFAPSTSLVITRGDQNKADELYKKRKSFTALMSVIFVSIIVAFIVNIFAAFIYDAIVPK